MKNAFLVSLLSIALLSPVQSLATHLTSSVPHTGTQNVGDAMVSPMGSAQDLDLPIRIAKKCSPQDKDCEEPDPGDGGPTTPPKFPPEHYRPDAMIEMNVIGCTIPQVQQLLTLIPQKVPGGRSTCVNGNLRVGAWRQPDGTGPQRDAAMNALMPMETPETLGLFVNGHGVSAQITRIWNDTPKRYSIENHKPASDGSIYLDHWGWDLHPLAPNRPYGKLVIYGDYSPPIFNNVAWTIEYYDLPSIDNNGHLTCSTGDPVVDIDTWLPLEAFVGDDDLNFVKRGPLCQALNVIGVATSQLLVPGGKKVDFNYSRLVNSGNDLIAGGMWMQVPRTPSIGDISANPNPIKVAPIKTSFATTVSANLHDLRPPLTITWTRRSFWNGAWSSWKAVDGATQTGALGTAGAWLKKLVTWPRPNPDVTPLTVQARVQITDADNLSTSKTLQISVQKTGLSGLPPVCDKKPYLPQCK